MVHVFTIPGRLPGMNEMIGMARSNRYAAAGDKKRYTGLCAAEATRQHMPRIKQPVIVEIMWVEKNQRRDLDNIAAGSKYILDGLQQAGVLENDGWANVKGLIHHFAIDPKRPRIEVRLEEVPDAT